MATSLWRFVSDMMFSSYKAMVQPGFMVTRDQRTRGTSSFIKQRCNFIHLDKQSDGRKILTNIQYCSRYSFRIKYLRKNRKLDVFFTTKLISNPASKTYQYRQLSNAQDFQIKSEYLFRAFIIIMDSRDTNPTAKHTHSTPTDPSRTVSLARNHSSQSHYCSDEYELEMEELILQDLERQQNRPKKSVQLMIADDSIEPMEQQQIINPQAANLNNMFQMHFPPPANFLVQSIASNDKIRHLMSKYEFSIEAPYQSTRELIQNDNWKDQWWVADRQLTLTQVKQEIRRVPVYFPFKPYPIQVDYMSAFIEAIQLGNNALLESPTGTGKTLCIICSALSWVDNFYKTSPQKPEEKVRVIYLSRTHAQLKQAQQELQKTCFRPTMVSLGSRDQLCIQESFSQIKGGDLMEACSKVVKNTKKARRVLKMEPEKLEEQVEDKGKTMTCQYYRNEDESLNLMSGYEHMILSTDLIKQEGAKHKFCPYFYSSQTKSRADMIFMPYNYLLDESLVSRYSDIIKGSILIFDEAHNVPEAACEGRSSSLNAQRFIALKNQVQKLKPTSHKSQQLQEVTINHNTTIEQLQRVIQRTQMRLKIKAKQMMDRIRRYSKQEQIEEILKKQDMKNFFYQLISPVALPDGDPRANNILQAQRQALIYITDFLSKSVKLIEELKGTYDGVFQHIEKFIGFFAKIQVLLKGNSNSREWLDEEINHYRLLMKVNPREDTPTYELNLACLTPSLTLQDIVAKQPRCIIFTSGTLSPLDSWQKQIKIPMQVKLSNKHVISQEQIHLSIATRSTTDTLLNFSFKQVTNRPLIHNELAETMLEIISCIPNGVLVIFPSYKMMLSFKDELKTNQRLLQKYTSIKQLCFEEKLSANMTLNNFKKKAMTAKGAILFCVCRGKVSEGMDFSDKLCRGVVFVGVPYPNIRDPLIQEKKLYRDELNKYERNAKVVLPSITGDQWYNLNTIRAVNQGIGRVIRHISDYGMIFLMDSRYERNPLRGMLPKWTCSSTKSYKDVNELTHKARQFFAMMDEKFPTRQQSEQKEKPKEVIDRKATMTNAFELMMQNPRKLKAGRKMYQR